MNEIVPPVYVALTLVFFGLTVASLPNKQAHHLAHERSARLAAAGALLAALGCLCVAMLPLVGRSALVMATAFVMGSFTAMLLRVRSWRMEVSRQRIAWTSAVVVGLCILNAVIVAIQLPLQVRVFYQFLLANGLLILVFRELRLTPAEVGTRQLHTLRISILGMLVLMSFWAWVIYQRLMYGGVVMFNASLDEPWLAFVLRLFVVALLVLAHVSANGYSMERMAWLRLQAANQQQQTEALNLQLKQLLNEKDEMLQALSFVVRSQNLPAIMSSLSHEINQPLGAIRLNADHLLAEGRQMSAHERQQLLDQLVVCSETATQVVQDFRRFFDMNQTPHSMVDLSHLLSDLQRAFQTVFSRHQVRVEFKLKQPAKVLGDPIQLESALAGALQYMLKRSSQQSHELLLSAECRGHFFHVWMLDDGPELTPVDFELAFTRIESGSTKHFSQSLWLSRAIVEHHGGAMNVHQENGKTGLSLQLPTAKE